MSDNFTYNDDVTATLTVHKSKTDQEGKGFVLAVTKQQCSGSNPG